MTIHASLGSAVGKTDDNHWGQTLVTPNSYGLIEISTTSKNARNRGVQILAELSRRLVSVDPTEISMTVLVGAVWDESIRSLILLVPVGDSVVVLLRGVGRVYIKRGEQLATLLGSTGVITGQVKVGDVLLLVSQGFTEVQTDIQLAASIDHRPAQEIGELLTQSLHASDTGHGSVALAYQVDSFGREPESYTEENVAPTKRNKQILPSLRLPRLRMSPYFLAARLGFWRTMRRFRSDRKSQIFVLILFLSVAFGVSVHLGIQKQKSDKVVGEMTQAITIAEYGLDEGVALLELNKVKSRERLEQAKKDIQQALAVATEKTPEGRKLIELGSKLDAAIVEAKQIMRVETVPFYDVSLLKKGAEAGQLSIYDDTVVVLDRLEKTVFSIDIGTKNAQIVAGGDAYDKAKYSGIHADKVYTITDKGIHESRLSDKKTTQNKIVLDDQIGLVTGLAAFGGNVYVADSTHNIIWRYNGTETGFGPRKPYLNPDALADLSKVTSMSIDGSIWFGTSDGAVLRFTQGLSYPFPMRDLDSPLGQMLVIFVSDTTKFVYVADVDNHRMVLFTKEGDYAGQYVWSLNLPITSMVVSESAKRVLLTSGGTMYGFGLK